jgi:hypothetical protein
MQRTLAITTLILAFGAGAALADGDIWRWKDAQGVYHYSDQWVPGSELIKGNRSRAPGEDDSARSAVNRTPSEPASDADRILDQQRAARTVAADVAKVKEKQCKEAQERYEKAIQARRMYKTTKDGQREYVSEDEANAMRVQAKNNVDLACGPAK